MIIVPKQDGLPTFHQRHITTISPLACALKGMDTVLKNTVLIGMVMN